MSVRKWSKWPAPFKIGALCLFILSIILLITLLWSSDTYVAQNAPDPQDHEALIRTTIASFSKDDVADIQYKKLGKNSCRDKTLLATVKFANQKKQDFVIKILGQNRWLSHRTHIMELYKEGAKIGISPEVFFANPDQGILILEYIPGKHISFGDLHNRDILKKLAHMMKQYHTRFAHIAPCADSNSLYVRVRRRLEELKTTDPLTEKIQKLTESYSPQIPNSTIAHNDLKISNILITPTGRLYIIDWGEAHHGNPIIDLASLSHHGGLSEYHEKYLLQSYFQRNLTPAEQSDLLWYKNLSLLHTSAWALRQGSDPDTANLIDQKKYAPQRLNQLLHKFYQEGYLSKKELKEMGNYGILYYLQNSLPGILYQPLKKN